MLRLDNGEDVSGQSGGDLRALDIDRESMFIGGIPIENDKKNMKNISRIAKNLGLRKVVGNYILNVLYCPGNIRQRLIIQ